MIVIPDIHGRTFWKDAVKKRKPREHVVFLGDYMDPYPSEKIEYTDAIKNLDEIIEFKKKHPSIVTLLIGNHDNHYVLNSGYGSRYDHFHSREISKRFRDNYGLFQLAYEKKIGGKTFIFSHAGIHKRWVEDWFKGEVRKTNVVKVLNKKFSDYDISLDMALDQFSAYRGGFESYGSIIWSDVREWKGVNKSDYGDVQVFGHTQLNASPININGALYDLDVRRAFRVDDDGNVCEMSGKIIPKTKWQ